MPDVIKPGPPGDDEDEQQEDQEVAMDLMGSGRDFPLQVSIATVCLCLPPDCTYEYDGSLWFQLPRCHV